MNTTEIKKNIQLINKQFKKFNDIEEYSEDEYTEQYDYKIKIIPDKKLEFKVLDGKELLGKYEVEIQDFSVKAIVETIISYIYECEINYRNSYIRGTKGFNSRKIKSIVTWSEKGKIEKVEEINKDLIDRYNNTKRLEKEVEIFKTIVRNMYYILEQLEPNWQIKQLQEDVNKEIKDNDLFCNLVDNKLIVREYFTDDKKLQINVNNFTKKEEVLKIIRSVI